MDNNATTCAPCKKKAGYSTISGLIPTFLVAILPKCPFCVMAYTGAMTLCGADKLYPNAGGLAAYISIALGVLVLVSLVFNFKGVQTWIALLFAALGLGVLISSQFFEISQFNYYIGTGMLFLGIWVNGSFKYFFKLAQRQFARFSNIVNTKTIQIK